jgi:hypothetical protein
VAHVVPADHTQAVGQAVGVPVLRRSQQQGRGVHHARGHHHDVGAQAQRLHAKVGVADLGDPGRERLVPRLRRLRLPHGRDPDSRHDIAHGTAPVVAGSPGRPPPRCRRSCSAVSPRASPRPSHGRATAPSDAVCIGCDRVDGFPLPEPLPRRTSRSNCGFCPARDGAGRMPGSGHSGRSRPLPPVVGGASRAQGVEAGPAAGLRWWHWAAHEDRTPRGSEQTWQSDLCS